MAVLAYTGKARSLTVAWGAGRPAAPVTRPAEAPTAPPADMSATVGPVTPEEMRHDRAKKANAALTTEQRSAAGKARAAKLHHPVTLAGRIAKAWPELSEDDRRAVRAELREAGVIR